MRINRKRLEESMEALGRVGATAKGGLNRVALTDDDRRGRDLLVEWMRQAGLSVTVDRMGNIFGQRAGSDGLPPVMMGSHADSVPTGGKYDGQLGVLCALEAIRTLNDRKAATRHPVAMAIFTNEEGARFQPAMIGSGVMAGKIPLEDAYNARDRDGVRLGDELERIGYLGAEPCVPRPLRAYLELHIEQGPILEEQRLSVGVVEGIVAISWSRLTLTGVQDHAGPTPMRIRHDALVAAAEIVRGVREIPRKIGGDMVSTVGRLDVTPNIPNAIPGRVRLSDRSARARRASRHPRPGLPRPPGQGRRPRRRRHLRARPLLARAADPLRHRGRGHDRGSGQGLRLRLPAHPLGRRTRRPVHGGDLPDGDDLRPIPRRAQPLRGGVHAHG